MLGQCKMYVAAVRIADEFGCDAIGIQYQQGLKDLAPASDLVEGTLNCSIRPPVRRGDGTIIREGEPIPHFNEVDECAGLDGLITHRVWTAMGMQPDNTLHDLRWGDRDASGTTGEYVWVFEISGSVPPTHFADGWRGASSERQPPMYFRLGGGDDQGREPGGRDRVEPRLRRGRPAALRPRPRRGRSTCLWRRRGVGGTRRRRSGRSCTA